jgi:hypothetical protein
MQMVSEKGLGGQIIKWSDRQVFGRSLFGGDSLSRPGEALLASTDTIADLAIKPLRAYPKTPAARKVM